MIARWRSRQARTMRQLRRELSDARIEAFGYQVAADNLRLTLAAYESGRETCDRHGCIPAPKFLQLCHRNWVLEVENAELRGEPTTLPSEKWPREATGA